MTTVFTLVIQCIKGPIIQMVVPLLPSYTTWIYASHLRQHGATVVWTLHLATGLQNFSSSHLRALMIHIKNALIPLKGNIQVSEKPKSLPNSPSHQRFLITLIHTSKLSPQLLNTLRSLLTLYQPEEKSLGKCAAEFLFTSTLEIGTTLTDALKPLAHTYTTDIMLRIHQPWRRDIRLLACDMDSTLIQNEVIDELARESNVASEVAAITHAAMHGQLNFHQSLMQRLQLLSNLPEAALNNAFQRIQLTPGAQRLFDILHALNCKMIIISGGFRWFAEKINSTLNAHKIIANELDIHNHRLTGNIVGPLIDARKKQLVLKHYAKKWNIPIHYVVALGDGANDLPMLNTAGTGIAFRAKPNVIAASDHALSYGTLDSLLYFLGWHEEEIQLILDNNKKIIQ